MSKLSLKKVANDVNKIKPAKSKKKGYTSGLASMETKKVKII
jgi:hypothetical protein